MQNVFFGLWQELLCLSVLACVLCSLRIRHNWHYFAIIALMVLMYAQYEQSVAAFEKRLLAAEINSPCQNNGRQSFFIYAIVNDALAFKKGKWLRLCYYHWTIFFSLFFGYIYCHFVEGIIADIYLCGRAELSLRSVLLFRASMLPSGLRPVD